jgi:hypothetical protein
VVAHACNPSYIREKDWENRGPRPTWAKSERLKAKVLEAWLKWKTASLASTKPWVQTLVLLKTKNQNKNRIENEVVWALTFELKFF